MTEEISISEIPIKKRTKNSDEFTIRDCYNRYKLYNTNPVSFKVFKTIIRDFNSLIIQELTEDYKDISFSEFRFYIRGYRKASSKRKRMPKDIDGYRFSLYLYIPQRFGTIYTLRPSKKTLNKIKKVLSDGNFEYIKVN